MKRFLLLALVAISFKGIKAASDWCDELDSCQGEHIDCTMASGKFGSDCPGNAVMLDLRNVQDTILNRMNELRNKVAGGTVSPLKAATRMGTLRWNVTFANLARKNVKQCADPGVLYDGCRNTPQFDFVGQNLAYAKYKPTDTRRNIDIIMSMIDYWYGECSKASAEDMAIFPGESASGDVIAHCTQLMKMQATRVGCAAMKMTKDSIVTMHLACNFDMANILGWPVYDAGKAASTCETGANPKYKNLCSSTEVFNVNAFWEDYE